MGTMGSGKTTVARLLAKELQYHLLEENFGENVFLPRFYNEMQRWAFHSQTFFLMEKLTQLFEVPALLARRSVVQDTLLEQDVYSYGKAQHVLENMDDAEWRLYQKIYHAFDTYFIKPDYLIYLETSIPVLLKRIASRGRGYEKKIPQSYLELLDMLNHTWLSENKSIPTIMVETDGLDIVKSQAARKKLITLVKEKVKR